VKRVYVYVQVLSLASHVDQRYTAEFDTSSILVNTINRFLSIDGGNLRLCHQITDLLSKHIFFFLKILYIAYFIFPSITSFSAVSNRCKDQIIETSAFDWKCSDAWRILRGKKDLIYRMRFTGSSAFLK